MKVNKKDFKLLYNIAKKNKELDCDFVELKEDERYLLRASNVDDDENLFRIEYIDKIFERDIVNIIVDYDKTNIDKGIEYTIEQINKQNYYDKENFMMNIIDILEQEREYYSKQEQEWLNEVIININKLI